MTAKTTRNLIIGLIILAVGIWILTKIGEGFVGSSSFGGDLFASLKQSSTTFLIGLVIIIIILIPVYAYQRSGEKKTTPAYA